jgi:hypothetical protein
LKEGYPSKVASPLVFEKFIRAFARLTSGNIFFAYVKQLLEP